MTHASLHPDTTPLCPGDVCFSTEIGKAVVVSEIITDGSDMVIITRGKNSKTCNDVVASRDTLKLVMRVGKNGPYIV